MIILQGSNFNWKNSRKMVSNLNEFFLRIKKFKVRKVSDEVFIEIIKIIEENPEFKIDSLGTISAACQSFGIWIHNICQYYKLLKQIKDNQ